MIRRFHRSKELAILGLMLVLSGTACAENGDSPVSSTTIQLPGAAPYAADLAERLTAAVRAQGEDYEPRTHHKREDGSAVYVNRLIFEDSPYLIQHAHNPVDWYPWGSEAFARAVAEDKPIFLSIGYSTCHWCHVMERESFESEEIAAILNEKFVCIKIDRERRPDIDDIYMTAVHLSGQRGGWPMSSFLTPEGKPFFGATYFPPEQFKALLAQVEDAWLNRRAELVDSAERIAKAVAEVTAARGEAAEIGGAFAKAVDALGKRHDATLGGFGAAPKFPHESELLFLLGQSWGEGSDGKRALAIVEKSLDAMARGGIYDQVGGGFHRYSVDARWLVPHFEKMLYNQAHLARAYLGAFERTSKSFFARVARQILDYVIREMTAPGGAFYSATDADSEGEEGLFFIWTPDELRAALSDDDAALAIDLFGVTDAGNFEGHNILHLPQSFDAYAKAKGLKLGDLLERVDRIRETLWQTREKRVHPIRDDKHLTSWNGMMITAFAAGYEVLGDERYLDAARNAAEFIWKHNHKKDGELWRVHLDGSSSIVALQEDYAYFAEALLALYDQSGDERWLDRARAVTDAMLEQFWDEDAGGFFMSAAEVDPHMIARPKSPSDGAIPSGNSVAVRALGQLAARTGEPSYADKADATLASFSGMLDERPSAFAYMLLGADEKQNGEIGTLQYAAAGKVRAAARLAADGGDHALTIAVTVREGWHINAHEPLQKELIPTVLTAGDGWTLDKVVYPKAETVELGFQDEPLAVYQGTVELKARLRSGDGDGAAVSPRGDSRGGKTVAAFKLKVQACNDEVCLRPEEIVLETVPR